MSKSKPRQALGRGLNAVLGMNEISGSSIFEEIEIASIKPNPNQPRTSFDEEALNDLSTSIKALGVIQPITVRKMEDNTYQIIAGERRYRASQRAGLTKVPAYIKIAEDEQVMKMALVENLQREDLDAIEVALGYKNLMEENDMTQDQLSEVVGKKRATIANYVRLLKLPAGIQLGIKEKKIDMGHARALLSIEDPVNQLNVYNKILSQGDMSVRQVEDLAKDLNGKNPAIKRTAVLLPDSFASMRDSLASRLNTKVDLMRNNKGKGKIVINFSSDEELEKLIKSLNEA